MLVNFLKILFAPFNSEPKYLCKLLPKEHPLFSYETFEGCPPSAAYLVAAQSFSEAIAKPDEAVELISLENQPLSPPPHLSRCFHSILTVI